MNREGPEYWLTRHAQSVSGVDKTLPLTPEGVEQTKERARVLAEMIAEAPPGTVIFHGGVSPFTRTRLTIGAYTNELKELLKDREDVMFVDREEIHEDAKRVGYLETARGVVRKAEVSPDAKVVIDLPLALKGLMDENQFYFPNGEVKPEWMALLVKHGKDFTSAVKEWFSMQPRTDDALPDPYHIAESYIRDMRRLDEFAKRFFPDRPRRVTFVGHSFAIDALLTYIANEGEITPEGFEKIGGRVVSETELSIIEPGTSMKLHYRDQDFELPSSESGTAINE
ncbi:MAG: hypothetical protein A3H71_00695 [Candidatus Sungbacteria bacterium RIFCSPLOWO2_02_FULL_48_13b]|uniref:Phosphoglycerate mutase n=2 Tax=Candidatus Sungiibacteriota TaxID=1817917 RepID=A0A1G2LKN1_9BACT|nr:MAG: hypothetical protein A3C12_01180 [Candidatus Sungbacteria bacterium RIFCSPHIGHO2_02_FULL_49_20]OHA11381.1 MAG: hypothetical protein A3H71_00695 [Candidatus Sungbacteria bacterium RIFCSPLOWO2_02_FULL_48_13b]